jgi:hypothetical protein
MSCTSTEEATSFKEGVSTNPTDFELPAGVKIIEPEYGNGFDQDESTAEEDREHMEKMQKMTYEEFRDFVKKEQPDAKEEDIKMIYKMMKAAAAGNDKK